MSKFHLYCVSGLAGLALLPPAQAATDCSAVTQIPLTECEVLLDIYNNTNGANWKDNTGWNETNTPCDWKGVNCGIGHVISLDLAYNELVGSIPDSLGNLSNLQRLNLDWNQLIGTIPESLGNLSNLQSLDLGVNQLSDAIPESLGQLNNLHSLDLSFNQLKGAIPESLGQLNNLHSLDLSGNRLMSGAIPESLGQLNNLHSLDLSGNQLSGAIPESLSQLNNLQNLDLNWNQLSDTIPKSLGQLSQLQSLGLQFNHLSGAIPESLGQLSQLQSLDLSRNLRISGTIPKSLGQLSQLQSLDLSINQLSGAIPESLGQLSQLQSLTLGWNQLSGVIPESLGYLSNLIGLYLNNNQLSGSIPNSLGNLSSLYSLSLSNNELCGDIPLSLMNLEELSYLKLNDNHLTASDPNLISWLTQLQPTWTSNQTPCSQAQTCLVYALYQDGSNNTQFTTIAPNLNFQINPLGNSQPSYDIKNIDILSATHELYAAAGGYSVNGQDYLYQINQDNGEFIPVCGTGLSGITTLSFHPTDNQLWVWSDSEGLFMIDINSIDNGTCHSTEVLRHSVTVTNITWDNAGQILYGLVGTTLYKYFSNIGAVEIACDNFPTDVTAIDTLADGSLLLAGHNANENHLYSFDPHTCSIIAQAPLAATNYGGIEGITWQCY